jgi:hypothetical protein
MQFFAWFYDTFETMGVSLQARAAACGRRRLFDGIGLELSARDPI